jgi:ribonuclease P/MRP protein subunit RPP1
MRFYEMHVHPEVELVKMIEFSRMLGWSGMCLVFRDLKELEEARRTLKDVRIIDIYFGLKIEAKKPDDVKRLAAPARRKADLILVHGGDMEVNRAAVETPEVDVLSHPEFGREEDSGFDHVMAKLAKENNVAIEFNFRELLLSYKKTRSAVLAHLARNAKLVRKYNVPFVLTSGAVSSWDMRGPSDLISFGKVLGLDHSACKDSMTGMILQENRKRNSGKWVMPGVEVE